MAELATICLCESRYPTAISEGSKEICRARVTYRTKINGVRKFLHAEGKLDTGGSVSLSHEEHLMDIKDCREYGMPRVKLSGIGGTSPYLDKGGILQIQAPDGSLVKVKMYVFNTAIGNTPKMLLFSLLSLREANMDILHHIDMSLNGKMAPLRFLGENSPSRYKRKRSKGPLGYNKLTKTELFHILKEKVDNGKTAPRHYVKASTRSAATSRRSPSASRPLLTACRPRPRTSWSARRRTPSAWWPWRLSSQLPGLPWSSRAQHWRPRSHRPSGQWRTSWMPASPPSWGLSPTHRPSSPGRRVPERLR